MPLIHMPHDFPGFGQASSFVDEEVSLLFEQRNNKQFLDGYFSGFVAQISSERLQTEITNHLENFGFSSQMVDDLSGEGGSPKMLHLAPPPPIRGSMERLRAQTDSALLQMQENHDKEESQSSDDLEEPPAVVMEVARKEVCRRSTDTDVVLGLTSIFSPPVETLWSGAEGTTTDLESHGVPSLSCQEAKGEG